MLEVVAVTVGVGVVALAGVAVGLGNLTWERIQAYQAGAYADPAALLEKAGGGW